MCRSTKPAWTHLAPGRLALVVTLCCLSFCRWTTSAGELKAAISTRVVTPDPLLPVSGGVGPTHPTHKKEGELTVRALVVEKDGVRLAVMSTDFLGFPKVLGDRVRKKVPGIPESNILIGATHTHSGPDMYAFPDGQGGHTGDLKYIDKVCDLAAEALGEAVARLEPVKLRVATGEAKGRIAYNYYADQLYDPRCHVLQFAKPDGQVVATLVNYAIHPEVIGSDQGILSPDLVGPLYARLTEKGGGVGIFMNSAQGGMVTADNRRPNGAEDRSYQECVRIGELLADEALRIVANTAWEQDPKLEVRAREVRFPVDSPLMLAILKGSPLAIAADAQGKVSTRLNLVNLGPAQILTIPGEALPNIGYYLKRKMGGKQNLLFGLTNDAFGYILTKVDWSSFKRYDYVSRTSLGEMTGEILIEEALKLVNGTP